MLCDVAFVAKKQATKTVKKRCKTRSNHSCNVSKGKENGDNLNDNKANTRKFKKQHNIV